VGKKMETFGDLLENAYGENGERLSAGVIVVGLKQRKDGKLNFLVNPNRNKVKDGVEEFRTGDELVVLARDWLSAKKFLEKQP
jgi:hypothetical protein